MHEKVDRVLRDSKLFPVKMCSLAHAIEQAGLPLARASPLQQSSWGKPHGDQ